MNPFTPKIKVAIIFNHEGKQATKTMKVKCSKTNGKIFDQVLAKADKKFGFGNWIVKYEDCGSKYDYPEHSNESIGLSHPNGLLLHCSVAH